MLDEHAVTSGSPRLARRGENRSPLPGKRDPEARSKRKVTLSKKIPGMTFPRIKSRQVGLLASDAEIQHLAKQWAEEDYSKLRLLCQHYRIQAGPTMYYELSLALARELFPEPKKRGRHSKWTVLNRGALVVEIERLANVDNPAYGVS
jgi:hypothetical protein